MSRKRFLFNNYICYDGALVLLVWVSMLLLKVWLHYSVWNVVAEPNS